MVAIVLLIFVPVTLMGVISYWIFSDTIFRKTSDFHTISLQETDLRLKNMMNEINSISDVGILTPIVQNILRRPARYVSDTEKQELNNLFLSHAHIASLSLYSTGRLVHHTGTGLSYEAFVRQPWHEKAVEQKGKPLWLGPYENPALANDEPLQLTHVRVIKDFYSLEDIGYLVLTIKPDLLDQVMWESTTLQRGDIFLVNKDGKVIFSKSGRALNEKADFPFLRDPHYSTSYTGGLQGTAHVFYLCALACRRLVFDSAYGPRFAAFRVEPHPEYRVGTSRHIPRLHSAF